MCIRDSRRTVCGRSRGAVHRLHRLVLGNFPSLADRGPELAALPVDSRCRHHRLPVVCQCLGGPGTKNWKKNCWLCRFQLRRAALASDHESPWCSRDAGRTTSTPSGYTLLDTVVCRTCGRAGKSRCSPWERLLNDAARQSRDVRATRPGPARSRRRAARRAPPARCGRVAGSQRSRRRGDATLQHGFTVPSREN